MKIAVTTTHNYDISTETGWLPAADFVARITNSTIHRAIKLLIVQTGSKHGNIDWRIEMRGSEWKGALAFNEMISL